MARTHDNHDHKHGNDCGHQAIVHQDHIDYLHDGCLHHPSASGMEEHSLDVNSSNPTDCTPGHACDLHEQGHMHGEGCGHPMVPHGDHFDYLVEGHLHHQHGDHCDDHGEVQMA